MGDRSRSLFPAARDAAYEIVGYAVGLGLALLTSLFARISGFDRDRAFYPTIVIVVAHYYVLFAAVGGSSHALVAETIAMALFVVAAIAGFRFNPWVVVAALAAHGVFDFFHHDLIVNPGVPPSWPSFCLAYDVGLAAILAWILRSHRQKTSV
jgi:hypothetical protein